MGNNCCVFTDKFCNSNGEIIIGKLTLKDGVFSKSFFDMAGNPYNGSIVLPNCSAIFTDFVNTESRLLEPECSEGEMLVALQILIEDISMFGIISSSIFHLNISLLLNGITPVSFELVDMNAVGTLIILPGNSIRIIDPQLIVGSLLNFTIKFRSESCSQNFTLSTIVDYISPLAASWGNGTHVGMTLNI